MLTYFYARKKYRFLNKLKMICFNLVIDCPSCYTSFLSIKYESIRLLSVIA